MSGWDSAVPDQTGRRGRLGLDQRLALTAAISRLQREFQGAFTTATIEQALYTSHDQVTADSAITRFPRAKRFARQQLQALARVQGHHTDRAPVVLFVSTTCSTTSASPSHLTHRPPGHQHRDLNIEANSGG